MTIMRRGKKGLFTHKRHVPMRFRVVEPRDTIWTALHTDDKTAALEKAHKIEILQDARWEALLAGRGEEAKTHYTGLKQLAERRGYPIGQNTRSRSCFR